MPYRRLPNTDQARIRAMEKLLEKVGMISVSEMAVSLNTISKIRGLLNRFRRLSEYYKDCFDNQSKASRKHQENTKLARLYISHFIQVLNLAVIRGDIKKDHKLFYQLELNIINHLLLIFVMTTYSSYFPLMVKYIKLHHKVVINYGY
jgi:hypothetical protein